MMSNFTIETYNKLKTLVAIFEDDGETGYLYLYDPNAPESEKIRASLHVYNSANIQENNVKVMWSNDEMKVGVSIEGKIWGIFDLRTGAKYRRRSKSDDTGIPKDILRNFL